MTLLLLGRPIEPTRPARPLSADAILLTEIGHHGSLVGGPQSFLGSTSWSTKLSNIQWQIHHDPFQPCVFFLDFFMFTDLVAFHPLILLLPSIKGLLRTAELANQISHGSVQLDLFQHWDHWFN